MTSDQERAKAFLDPNYFRDEAMAEEVARLAAEFAAVRADERGRIVSWLRQPTRASLGAYEVGAGAERGRVADEIENGEASGGPS